MAYGGGFLGGLSEFAGGVAQGIQTEKKMRMQREEHDAAMEEAQARKEERQRLKDMRTKIGGVSQWAVAPGAMGLNEEQFATLSATPPAQTPQAPAPETPQAQPEVQANLQGFPELMAQQAPTVPQVPAMQQPSASPTALPPMGNRAALGTTVAQAFSPEAIAQAPIGAPQLQGAMPAPIAQQTPPAAQTPAPTPATPADYVKVGDSYFRRDQVKQRDVGDYYRDLAGVVMPFDQEMAGRLMTNAFDLDERNIRVTAAKYGDAVMRARRAYEANPEEGLKQLQAAWGLMPDLTDVRMTRRDDGKIEVRQVLQRDGKDTTIDRGVFTPEDLWAKAASYTDPTAMRQWSVDQAAAAQRAVENAFAQHADVRAERSLDFQISDANAGRALQAQGLAQSERHFQQGRQDARAEAERGGKLTFTPANVDIGGGVSVQRRAGLDPRGQLRGYYFNGVGGGQSLVAPAYGQYAQGVQIAADRARAQGGYLYASEIDGSLRYHQPATVYTAGARKGQQARPAVDVLVPASRLRQLEVQARGGK